MAVRVSAKGQVVIPREIREKYGFNKGARVAFVEYGGVLSIVRLPEDSIKASRGMLKGTTPLTEGLLRDRREDAARDK